MASAVRPLSVLLRPLAANRVEFKISVNMPLTSAAGAPVAPPPSTAANNPAEDPATNARVLALLTKHMGASDGPGSKWSTLTHEPTPTSEDSARVRGATLASGAKAMLLSVKPGNDFVLAVISAAAKMDSKLMKKAVRCLARSGDRP